MGDSFTYDTWQGHYNLVKLNLYNEEVIQYLLDCVNFWIDTFAIDGLRLDAADCIPFSFFNDYGNSANKKRRLLANGRNHSW